LTKGLPGFKTVTGTLKSVSSLEQPKALLDGEGVLEASFGRVIMFLPSFGLGSRLAPFDFLFAISIYQLKKAALQ
jgi:hypothetical protein